MPPPPVFRLSNMSAASLPMAILAAQIVYQHAISYFRIPSAVKATTDAGALQPFSNYLEVP
jgi:hypothetical protein